MNITNIVTGVSLIIASLALGVAGYDLGRSHESSLAATSQLATPTACQNFSLAATALNVSPELLGTSNTSNKRLSNLLRLYDGCMAEAR